MAIKKMNWGAVLDNSDKVEESAQAITDKDPNRRTMEKIDEISKDEQYIAQIEDCVDIIQQGISYEYDENKQAVIYTIEQLKNESAYSSGSLKLHVWKSQNRFEDGWVNDNYELLGDIDIATSLAPGQSIDDLKLILKMQSELSDEERFHFVFTINEYCKDGKWYITDYRNGECYLSRQDYEMIIRIITDKLGVEREEVQFDSNLFNDLGADSLDSVELIMDFEKEFKLRFQDEETENLRTVGDIIQYLEDHL